MKQRVTIEDIAQKVGCSKSLVSLALSNKYGVSESVRSKIIMEAIKMGYEFKNNKSHTSDILSNHRKRIFVCFPKSMLEDDNYWMEIITHVEQHLRRNFCFTQISSWDKDSEADDLPYTFYRSGCDGLIGFATEIPPDSMSKLQAVGKPMIFVDSGFYMPGLVNVKAANHNGMYWLAQYLEGQGHSHMCFVGDASREETFAERRGGLRRYVELHPHIRMDYVDSPIDSDISEWVSLGHLHRYLEQEDRATVLICLNDAVAARVYETAEELGLKIPDDISVAGFDGIKRGAWLKPALTTCAVDRDRVAEMATALLLNQLNNASGKLFDGVRVEIPVGIIVRDSVKNLNTESCQAGRSAMPGSRVRSPADECAEEQQ